MGHHIDSEGRFQSDKFPDLAPDKIVLSFKDPNARIALREYAAWTKDAGLSNDVLRRCHTIERDEE